MPIYKALFELSIDAILVADAEGRFVDANPAARKLLGLPREEILGRHIMELSDPALDFPTAWGALHSGGSLRGEWRLRHSDGTYRDVEFAANASVEPGRSAAILRDVTEKKRAEHELKASREDLRALFGRLQDIREEERTRIARSIHDELGQSLTALKIDLAWVEGKLADAPPFPASADVAERIRTMRATLHESTMNVRRISAGLRPAILDALGLVPALEWQAKDFKEHTGIDCRLNVPADPPELEPTLSTALFRIFQEAMTNVARHSRAKSVNVDFVSSPKAVVLEVRDDGRGIDESRRSGPGSLGLLGIRERVAALGGTVEIDGVEGKGTRVFVEIPLG